MKTVSGARPIMIPPLMTTERKKAIQHAIHVMEKGLSWGGTLPRFTREEMHECQHRSESALKPAD